MSLARSPRGRWFLAVLGALYVLLGLGLNEWLLARILSVDGQIPPAKKAVIRTFDVLFVAWGLATIALRRWRLVTNLNLTIISMVVLLPVTAEGLLRVGLAAGIPRLRRPALFANPCAESFWALHALWGPDSDGPRSVHPTLGWAPETTAVNPLGVVADSPYTPRFDLPAVLFYGDSFVAGTTPIPDAIPQQLGRLLPGRSVYNYGVSNYGVDQIYLRFRETHRRFKSATIVIGILTEDLGRCLLSIRGAPKPYFVLENGALELRGVPVPASAREWVRAHPPRFSSYFFALLATRLQIDDPRRRIAEERINEKIIEAIVREARETGRELLFVIFYGEPELHTTGRREQFLQRQIARWQVPVVDTKEILLAAARRDTVNPGAFYQQAEGHPNARGNRVMAQAIAERLLIR